MKKEYEGVNKLAQTLQNRMRAVSKSPMVLDFGVINDDLSLTTNSFPIAIPVEDYMVAQHLTLGPIGTVLTKTFKDTGPHSHNPSASHLLVDSRGGGVSGSITIKEGSEGKHTHDIGVPEKMRCLNPGDRVIVGWVGNDVVVLDRILPAKGNVKQSNENKTDW